MDLCMTYVEKIEVRRCNLIRDWLAGFLPFCVLCHLSVVLCRVSCVHMDPCMWGKLKQEGAIIIGDWLAGVCLITGQDARACHCHHCKQVGAGEWRKREREYGRFGDLYKASTFSVRIVFYVYWTLRSSSTDVFLDYLLCRSRLVSVRDLITGVCYINEERSSQEEGVYQENVSKQNPALELHSTSQKTKKKHFPNLTQILVIFIFTSFCLYQLWQICWCGFEFTQNITPSNN